MAALSESLQLRKRVEALLEAQGFEDADEWGPDLKGCLRWAKEVEPGDICSALSNLVSFLEELDSAGIQQDMARRIVGDGKRTVKMMKDLLVVHNKLIGEGHDDQIESIVTSSTTITNARRLLKNLLEVHTNPPPAVEERATKRHRKQAERPGYVSSIDPTLSFSHSNPKYAKVVAAGQGVATGTNDVDLPAKHAVPFCDLSPARVFVADAATHPSARAKEFASELQNDDARFENFGQPTPAGLRYALFQNRYGDGKFEPEYKGKLDQQVLDMIASPSRVEENVGIEDIKDESHPAFNGRISKDHPAYGSFARKRMPKHFVLGAYGGHTKVDGDAMDASEERAHCQFFLHVERTDSEQTESRGLFVDADKFCNQLAFCNDYRTDTVHYDDPKAQEGYYSHHGQPRNKRHNVEQTIIWKEGELFPRVFFVTTRPVQVNEELLLDYGSDFWKQEQEHEHEQGQSDWSQSSQDSSVELCSQSSCSSQPVGLRRRKSLTLPGLPKRSRLAERQFLQYELDQWRKEMKELERLFEKKIREETQLFEEEQRRRRFRVMQREEELRLVGRQVLEKFPGHGTEPFRGTIIRQLDGQNSQGLSVYKVRYADGESHRRSEDKLLSFLVDRDAEDQEAKQRIADMPASSDEEEQVVVEGEEHEESTQPFMDDESVEQDELTTPADDESLDCSVVVGQLQTVRSINSASLASASSTPPVEIVSRPAAGELLAT